MENQNAPVQNEMSQTGTTVQSPQPCTTMSYGQWMLTLLLCAIPIVNLICLIIWAVNHDDSQKTKSNFAKAQLTYIAIGVVLWIILFVFVGVSTAAML